MEIADLWLKQITIVTPEHNVTLEPGSLWFQKSLGHDPDECRQLIVNMRPGVAAINDWRWHLTTPSGQVCSEYLTAMSMQDLLVRQYERAPVETIWTVIQEEPSKL